MVNITGISNTTPSTDGGDVTLSSYGWTYDADGDVTSFTSPDGTLDYAYDASNQLTGVTSGGSAVQSQTYDANGNRTAAAPESGSSTSYTVGADNEVTFDGTYYYAYDADGNRIEKYQKDSSGDPINVTTYTYDNRDRLTSVTTSTSTTSYGYDAFNRLVSTSVTPSGDSSPTSTEYYIYDGDNLLLTLNDSSDDVAERYLDGPAVDQVFASENGSTGAVDWLLTDDLGTVRDVVAYNASTGNTDVLDHIVYDAFGNVVSQTNAANQPAFLFAGEQYDPNTGLYYDHERGYDSVTGAFMSEDPLGFGGGDSNLYRYVGNDPTTLTDPSGMADWLDMAPPGSTSSGNANGVGVDEGGWGGAPGGMYGSAGVTAPVYAGYPLVRPFVEPFTIPEPPDMSLKFNPWEPSATKGSSFGGYPLIGDGGDQAGVGTPPDLNTEPGLAGKFASFPPAFVPPNIFPPSTGNPYPFGPFSKLFSPGGFVTFGGPFNVGPVNGSWKVDPVHINWAVLKNPHSILDDPIIIIQGRQ